MGNIYSVRDWGHAKDYIKGFWTLLNKLDVADDFIIATNQCWTVKDFITKSFIRAGMDVEWKGKDLKEKLYCKKSGKVLC